MSMDKLLNKEEAERFLRSVGLTVKEDVVRRVVAVVSGEEQNSLYDLHKNGVYRKDGIVRKPICSQGTVNKIRKLFEEGMLDPYLVYIRNKAVSDGFNKVIANYSRNKSRKQDIEELLNLISDWELELPLSLNYLDNLDLSKGEIGVPHSSVFGTGLTIKWEDSSFRDTIRKFSIEDRDEFKNFRRDLPQYDMLWKPFRRCQQFGGVIINRCANLGENIRDRSEAVTNLKIKPSAQEEEPYLDRYFSWTVYADALGLLPDNSASDSYDFSEIGNDLRLIQWKTYRLAIVPEKIKDAIVDAHQKLRTKYQGSKEVKEIFKLKRQVDTAERHLRAELQNFKEYLYRL